VEGTSLAYHGVPITLCVIFQNLDSILPFIKKKKNLVASF